MADFQISDEAQGGWGNQINTTIPLNQRLARAFKRARFRWLDRVFTAIFGDLKTTWQRVRGVTLWTDHFAEDMILLDADLSVSPVEVAPVWGEANGHIGPQLKKSSSFSGFDDINPVCFRERAKLADGELELNVAIETVANQIQDVELLGSPTGGTWSLTFDGEQTTSLDHDASAADVENALKALPNIRANEVAVTGTQGGPYEVTFMAKLANDDVPLMTYTNNLTGDGDEDVSIVGSAASGDVVLAAAFGPSVEGPWTWGSEKKISHDPVYAGDYHTVSWDFGDGVHSLNDLVFFKVYRDKKDNDDTLDAERVVAAHGRSR